jgi:hypothetical protein
MNDPGSNMLRIWQAKELANLDWDAGTQETQKVIKNAVETYWKSKPDNPSSPHKVLDMAKTFDDKEGREDFLLGYVIVEKLTPVFPVPPKHWVRCSDQLLCEAVNNYPRLYDDDGNQLLPESALKNAPNKKAIRNSPETAEEVLRKAVNTDYQPHEMYKMNMFEGK